MNWILGLNGEIGELTDEIKKNYFHAKPINMDKIASELGDILWYLTIFAGEFNLSLEEIAVGNIAKLRARHGNTFKKHDDQNRNESQTRDS